MCLVVKDTNSEFTKINLVLKETKEGWRLSLRVSRRSPRKPSILIFTLHSLTKKLAARKMQAFNLEIWAEAVSYMAQ